ncbi:MAG: potassium/proton antiporter [Kiritimatiellae bacterium]|nr:potassium/proton antiporter [Kiritimatiellia bacterium]
MDTLYLVAPLLLIAVVLAAVWLDRWSVPVILVALGAGILFGSDVLGLWDFSNMRLTNEIANFALVLILFTGGFNTRWRDFRSVALPAGGLATWGVLLTALATFLVLHNGLHWELEKSLLLAVIISSTDAAAIFSILRRQSLPTKLSSTIEIESAANDPMAILLTVISVQAFASGQVEVFPAALLFVWKFTAGPVIGWLLAQAAMKVFNKLHPQDRGHYYVLSLGIVLLIYGVAEKLAHASGMLAVFIAGHVMGNTPFVHKQGVANFFNGLSTIANIGMFALMGLLVFPHQWSTLWVQGIVLFVVLTFIGRPVAVLLGTIGMRLGWRNKTLIAWAGLRGSVPVILATYPAAAGLPSGQEIFNLVFFAVLLSVLLQGSTLGVVAKWLGLSTPARPRSLYVLELITMAESDLDLFVVDLPDPQGAHGPKIADLRLPTGAVITLITRGKEPLVPKGSTELQGWDQVTVLAHAKDEAEIRSLLLDPFEESEAT